MLMYTSYNSDGRVLLIDGGERRNFFSAEGEGEVAECRASVTSDLWECQQVSEPKENTAAVAALNQP